MLPALLTRGLLFGALATVAAYHVGRIFDLNHKSYGEGPILALTERLEAEPISARWRTRPPYTLSCYGPAYYWASGALARLGGGRHSIIPGRLISVTAALVVAALMASAVGRRTNNRTIGMLAALMFLVSSPVTEWLPYARVDLLALVAATAAYLTAEDNRRGPWLAALALAAGSLAKPTVALAAVPITIHYLVCDRYRHAAHFAVLVAMFGAAAWSLVEWVSGGYFLSAVLSGNRNPMSVWRGYRFGYEFLGSPLGVGACIAAVSLWIASREQFTRSLFSLGFVVSLAISTLLVCKRGSDLNYFLEPAMLAGLAIAVDGLPRLYAASARRANFATALLAIVLIVPVLRDIRANPVVRHLLTWAERGESPPEATREGALAQYAAVRRMLADQPGGVGVLADGQFVDMVLAAGWRPWVNDSYLYMLLTDNGTLEPRELIEQVRNGHIQWLFLHDSLEAHLRKVDRQSNLWPPEVLQCLADCFERVPAPEGIFIYRHRRSLTSSSAKGGKSATVPEAMPASSSSRACRSPSTTSGQRSATSFWSQRSSGLA